MKLRFYGVMVRTQDSESCDPSSNLGSVEPFIVLCLMTCAVKQMPPNNFWTKTNTYCEVDVRTTF